MRFVGNLIPSTSCKFCYEVNVTLSAVTLLLKVSRYEQHFSVGTRIWHKCQSSQDASSTWGDGRPAVHVCCTCIKMFAVGQESVDDKGTVNKRQPAHRVVSTTAAIVLTAIVSFLTSQSYQR